MKVERDPFGRPFVIVNGIKAYIGTDAECEAADVVVCGPVSYFPDDVHGRCADCRAPIVWRPYAPTTPPHVCIDCALQRAEQEKPRP